MDEKLLQELKDLQSNLEGKTSTEIKEAMDAFEIKVADASKETKEAFDTEIKAMQDQFNELAAKQNEVAKLSAEPKDELKQLIVDNYDEISLVRKGKAISLETKAVANMTLSSALSGDQPRTYTDKVAMLPGQLVNVADILGAPINISGGTFTYPLESGGEGTITTQTEGSDKAQVDFDITMTDISTDFIAGFAVYSKKMANNLPFLESFIPQALRRNYWMAENTVFNTALASAATSSSQIITSKNKVEMLINEIATLEGTNYAPNVIVVKPSDFYSILVTEKSTGAGYGLPGVTTFTDGRLMINGIRVVKANWLGTNKYYVGDWSQVKKIVTAGLSVEFSENDEDNFRKNNITARVEAQVGIGLLRTGALIYGDFTAT